MKEKDEKKDEIEKKKEEWVPRTKLGKLVQAGEITGLEQVYEKGYVILEPEIVDKLIPNLKEEVLDIKTVQKITDSGRRNSFRICVAIGNGDGSVGVGIGKGREVRPTIDAAIRNAKKNIIHIRRGCGSWECTCEEPHSIPFKVTGRGSSVRVELLPAPKGTGIIGGKTTTKILELAGIKDVWSRTIGSSGTVLNAAIATINALKKTRKKKLQKEIGVVR